jgi:hypothetical protein
MIGFRLSEFSFVVFALFFLSFPAYSSIVKDILPEQNSLLPENILLARTSTSTSADKPAVYNLKRWIVEEKADPVTKALEVYKSKFESKYSRQIWITDRKDGRKRLVAQYLSRKADDKFLFSEDENFLYYYSVTKTGQNKVYGVNLTTDMRFPLGAGDDFDTVSCPDQKSYVVVHVDYDQTVYRVFTSTGQSFKTLINISNPADIEKNLCR